MLLARTQSILKRVLPNPAFEWLYRLATSLYYTRQGIADWVYYHTPRINDDKWIIRELTAHVRPYTMVGRNGLMATCRIVLDTERQEVDGQLVECGVAQGGCAALMLSSSWTARMQIALPRSIDPQDTRVAWLFDSFEGLPEPTAEDGVLRKPQGKDKSSWDLAKGYCLGTLEEVEDLLFGKFGFSRDKVHLIKGWFQDTLPEYKDKVGDIAVLRIDGDWYESTKCCLENLYDQVVDGGYVILDDYALVGCRKAVDEFFGNKGEGMPEVVLDGRGGGWFRKKGETIWR